MKKSKLDNPVIKESVIKQIAVGVPQKEIAKQVGLDRSQISRFSNRKDIKPFIEHEQLRLVEVVPDAVENVKNLVRGMKDIPEGENKRRELSYKATSDVLKSVGLLATPVHSQTLVNIYNNNSDIHFAPEVMEILKRHLHENIPDGEIIDQDNPEGKE